MGQPLLVHLFALADDNFDEGTVVIIGWTHFFTGGQHTYSGMLASSHVDAKDCNNDGSHVVANCQRHNCWSSGLWEDGDLGHCNKDLMWSTKEQTKRNQYDNNDNEDLLRETTTTNDM